MARSSITVPVLLTEYSVGGIPAALPAPWSLLAALVADYLTTCVACEVAQVERDLRHAQSRVNFFIYAVRVTLLTRFRLLG